MKLQMKLMNKSEKIEGLQDDILAMQQMVRSYLNFTKGENGEKF